MKSKTLKIFITSIFLFFIIITSFLIYSDTHPPTTTLTIGIYAGSSWDVPDNEQYHMINYTIHKFQKKHPNIKINYESGIRTSDYINWLSEKIIEGKTPDVIMMPQSNFNLFASNNTFLDLSPFLNKDNLRHSFYPGALASGQYNGKQFTLPYETNPTLLIANQTILTKNKIHSLYKINNVEYFRNICHQISLKKNQYGITDSYNWQDAILACNVSLFTGNNHELELTNLQARHAFNLIEDLKSNAPIHNVTQEMFDQGKVAFMPLPFAQFRTYTTYPYYVTEQTDFEKKAIKMPGQNSTPASTVGFGISKNCKNSKLAWEFIRMLCSNRQVQQELMKTNMGCSVLPKVIKSLQTKHLLLHNSATRKNISTKQLDLILRDETIYPKFKNYNQIMYRLDYQIQESLNKGNLDSQLFNIQLNINKNP